MFLQDMQVFTLVFINYICEIRKTIVAFFNKKFI